MIENTYTRGGSILGRRSAFHTLHDGAHMPHTLVLGVRAALIAATLIAATSPALYAQSSAHSVTVCGIDRSGSAKQFLATAVDVCANEIASASAGSTVIVRWISEASYRSNEEAVRVTIPPAIRCANLYDFRCKRASGAAERNARSAKRAALTTLLSLRPATAPRTDLIGYMQAAADAFAEDTAGSSHRLVVATDLVDTRGFRTAPVLKGADVLLVLLISDEDPAKVVSMRDRWIHWFERLGAQRVAFRHPGVLR